MTQPKIYIYIVYFTPNQKCHVKTTLFLKDDEAITSEIIDHFLSSKGNYERLPGYFKSKPVIDIQKPYLTLKLPSTNFWSNCV